MHFQNLLFARAESLRGIFRAVYRQLEFKATGMKFKATVATSPGMGSNPMGVLKMEMMAGCKNKMRTSRDFQIFLTYRKHVKQGFAVSGSCSPRTHAYAKH